MMDQIIEVTEDEYEDAPSPKQNQKSDRKKTA